MSIPFGRHHNFLYARLKNGSYYTSSLAGGLAGGRRPIFSLEHIFYTHGGILMKLHRNAHHNKRLCFAHKAGLLIQGQLSSH
jgi:hypothetical protein